MKKKTGLKGVVKLFSVVFNLLILTIFEIFMDF